MIFETSGSTGQPKRVEHVSALLRREAAFFLKLIGPRSRVVRFVPRHHLYGYIFGVLLPEMGGIPLFDARTFYDGYRHVRFQTGDLIVATPHQWQFLLDRKTVFPPGSAGVTSAAPCPTDLFEQLQSAGLRILDVYGSTETSGAGYRFDVNEPYELLPWRPAFDGAIEQNDNIRWVAPRSFFVEGRRDGGVEVSGMNVYPTAVEKRLRENPDVRDCAVRLMRPGEGRRLKAFLVTAKETDTTALEQWIANRFTGPEQIASIRYGAELPRSAEGKLTDW